jgi:hypothetical protein
VNNLSVPSETIQHLASGEAALLLLECVLHQLLDRKLLSTNEILDAIETAISTKRQMILDGEHAEVASVAIGTLQGIANSLVAADSKRRRNRTS